jgi:hypothetical protein
MKKSSKKAVKQTEKTLKVAAGIATAAGVLGLLLKNKDKISAYLQGQDSINTNIEKALIYKNEQLLKNPDAQNTNVQNTGVHNIDVQNPLQGIQSKIFPENGPVQVVINNYASQESVKPSPGYELPVINEVPEPQNSCTIL